MTLLKKEVKDVVAVTGDGGDDAPASHESHVGLTLGTAGTQVAKESTDIILDNNFSAIVNVAKWGCSVSERKMFVQSQLMECCGTHHYFRFNMCLRMHRWNSHLLSDVLGSTQTSCEETKLVKTSTN